MNKLKNKKGQVQLLLIVGIIMLIIFFIVGGASIAGLFGITNLLKSIPAWFWIGLVIILFLILITGGKRK